MFMYYIFILSYFVNLTFSLLMDQIILKFVIKIRLTITNQSGLLIVCYSFRFIYYYFYFLADKNTGLKYGPFYCSWPLHLTIFRSIAGIGSAIILIAGFIFNVIKRSKLTIIVYFIYFIYFSLQFSLVYASCAVSFWYNIIIIFLVCLELMILNL